MKRKNIRVLNRAAKRNNIKRESMDLMIEREIFKNAVRF
jgi:hypothetical protein